MERDSRKVMGISLILNSPLPFFLSFIFHMKPMFSIFSTSDQIFNYFKKFLQICE